MFIKKLMFLVSIINGLKFATIEYLSSKKEIALVIPIKKIVSYYKSNGLHLGTMFVDPKFQFLEENIFSTTLNKTRARDHVPEVERHIQVIKDQMRAHHSNLLFASFTR